MKIKLNDVDKEIARLQREKKKRAQKVKEGTFPHEPLVEHLTKIKVPKTFVYYVHSKHSYKAAAIEEQSKIQRQKLTNGKNAYRTIIKEWKHPTTGKKWWVVYKAKRSQ